MALTFIAYTFCLLSISLSLACYTRVRQRLCISSERNNSPPTLPSPRFSKDPALIQSEYDVVIIGSGYGAGVAASRFVRAGKKVCILERGAERWAGQFPHTLKTVLREYRINDMRSGRQRNLGKASGLYQTNKGEGQDVVSGCGLGGTSLINAGVFLKADSRIFEGPEWPIEIRENSHGMAQYYKRGEQMFRPTPYPESFPKPRKLSVFEHQWKYLGLQRLVHRPPLTISFGDCINKAGVTLHQSTGSGNECTGVNDGSKNSVLVTYLADAWAWGAEMFCGVDVKYVRRLGSDEGYLIYYGLLDSYQGSSRALWVRAKELVVLGAGALGTTEILLRSRSYGLPASPVLGQRLSSNGDRLAFAYNCDQSVNAIGRDTGSASPLERCGPTITACLDMRGKKEAPNVEDGFVVQEGAVPEALGPVIQMLIETRIPTRWSYQRRALRSAIARLRSWIQGPYCVQGSVNRTEIYLVMSHDANEGTMVMSNGMPTLQWSGIGAESRCKQITSLLERATASTRGTYVTAPSITVHPLGGACMSNDGSGLGGVVNDMGQVFSGSGREVHEGIICVDASIVPTSLGVNPCATIVALAERCCELLVHKRGWTTDERMNKDLKLKRRPSQSCSSPSGSLTRENQLQLIEEQGGLRFEETLHGFLQVTKDDCSFETAANSANKASSSVQAAMTVGLYRTEQGFFRGCATGTVSFGALSHDSLLITKGTVDFFTVDESVSDAVNLIYNLKLLSTDGNKYVLYGSKTIDSRVAFSPARTWGATTTLHTTISGTDGNPVAKGILRLSLRGFLSELLSMRCSPRVGFVQQIYLRAKFLSYFARNVTPYVLSPFRPLHYSGQARICPKGWNKAEPIATRIRSVDGVEFCMKTWEPSPHTITRDTPIVLIPGASVDDQIFSLPTIPVNTIDYFTSQGYRCYVPVLRFGIGDAAKDGWTVFDARLDVKAALEYVRAQEDNRKVYAIVHCLGSIATATALLHGDIEASWFCGMTCSQVFTDLIYSKDNNFKAEHQSLIGAYSALAGHWFSCRASPSTPCLQYVLDQFLRFYPTGSRKELCNSAVCHRCNVPFGRCWNHANLNHATHARLDEFFDGIHMNFLTHLSKMGVTSPRHVRDNAPGFVDLVTVRNMQRLTGLRICFLSGGDNAVWEPSATKKSLDMFRQMFPNGRYARTVVQDYGHLDCWIGKEAHRDVYPRVMHHVQICEPAQEMSDGCGVPVADEGFVVL